MIERFQIVLNSMLCKVISQDQRDWPDHLPTVMVAYHAFVHEATRFSPNKLVLGRETRLPVDVMYALPPEDQRIPRSYDVMERYADIMRADFKTVRDNMKCAAQIRQDRYDTMVKQSPLQMGQRVWYYCPRRRANLSPEWQSYYSGPFQVIRIIDPHVMVIARSKKSKPITVHRDKLKPVVVNDEHRIFAAQAATMHA